MIQVSAVSLSDDVEALVLDVLRSGMLAQGRRVKELEDRFAEMIGVPHVVAVNNGTTALVAAMQALGIGPGDEVITSPFTFVATLNAILEVGATARFADISELDFCVEPREIDVLAGPNTAAIMPVHLYGQSADMPAIAGLAERLGVALVEDAAQAHGATIDGRATGSWGVGCFSLYATKNITSGEGGLISTSDDAVADRLRVLRNQGMRERYVYEMAGHNYRMTDLQAAVCLPQLDTYGDNVSRRRANAARLTEGLRDIPFVTTPAEMPGRQHVWHQYTLLLSEDAPVTRDGLADALHRSGVGSGVYYPRLVFDYDCYRTHPGVVIDPVPVAESVASRCLSLPVHPLLTASQVDEIIDAVHTALGGAA
jgi:perosamine synthetase